MIQNALCLRAVAPLAGAWIEIRETLQQRKGSVVAPLAGAWIEICEQIADLNEYSGRSPRGSVD